MRRRVFSSQDWRASGWDGMGFFSRRTFCGRSGRSCRGQLVQVSRPEVSAGSLLLPAPQAEDHSSRILYPRPKSLLPKMMNADMDDLSARVDAVKEENLKLKSENQVLGQYIENLMSASSVFQTTDTKSKRK
ncbi:short coiled-coil protein [Homo sapiens]|uniref:Isoform 4 of Short coiled-coil protein n=1 Tax=Homo sapiens TaxID=9606 RepID=Q9UIL1-4|nr:short coiled-coil protein [Homo sapiens]KAI4027072.1 short coiled-coil protein [Homo sapiens]|eukprot:NP_001147024.1 short coiled-coil protein isoform 3 [Homo sapiens]